MHEPESEVNVEESTNLSYFPSQIPYYNEIKKDELNKKYKIVCDYNISNKCKYEYIKEYIEILRTKQQNDSYYICIYCLKKIKFLDRDNKKYIFNEELMEKIDTERKAYILGWIVSQGNIQNNLISIIMNKKKINDLIEFRDIICKKQIINEYDNNNVSLIINSKKICNDVCKQLKNEEQKSDRYIYQSLNNLPEIKDEVLLYIFLRGYFESNGDIYISSEDEGEKPRCNIISKSKNILNSIKKECNIPCTVTSELIEWSGVNCLDFLGKIYDNPTIYLKEKYKKYIEILNWSIDQSKKNKIKYFKYVLCSNEAKPPIKTKKSDTGWDLTLVRKLKEENNIYYYTTDIKIQPQYGYWFKIVPRSSLCKKGWGLANHIGIIDISYIGLINIALFKIDSNANELELPCKCVQIIPEKLENFEMIETTESDIEDSIRCNTGGLGSSQFK